MISFINWSSCAEPNQHCIINIKAWFIIPLYHRETLMIKNWSTLLHWMMMMMFPHHHEHTVDYFGSVPHSLTCCHKYNTIKIQIHWICWLTVEKMFLAKCFSISVAAVVAEHDDKVCACGLLECMKTQGQCVVSTAVNESLTSVPCLLVFRW